MEMQWTQGRRFSTGRTRQVTVPAEIRSMVEAWIGNDRQW